MIIVEIFCKANTGWYVACKTGQPNPCVQFSRHIRTFLNKRSQFLTPTTSSANVFFYRCKCIERIGIDKNWYRKKSNGTGIIFLCHWKNVSVSFKMFPQAFAWREVIFMWQIYGGVAKFWSAGNEHFDVISGTDLSANLTNHGCARVGYRNIKQSKSLKLNMKWNI